MGVMGSRRIVLAGVVFACSLAGSVSLSTSAALAVAPPVVEEEAVLDVAATSATVRAQINPEGSETTYRFEYGTSEGYGSSVPVPDGIVGSGSAGITVSAHPQGLLPSTSYHYRVVALVASTSEAVAGVDGTFTTQPVGGEFSLPDGRQWELVSPPNKHGARFIPLDPEGNGSLQAAEDGSGIVYQVDVPTEAEPAGAASLSQVRSVRGTQGWSSQDIVQPHSSVTGPTGYPEYDVFSRDLSLGLADPRTDKSVPLLSSLASEQTLYLRREALCDASATASECYLPLLTGNEGVANVPPGAKFGEVGPEIASPDLSHVLLKSEVALTATPLAEGPPREGGRPDRHGVYEWSAGVAPGEALQLVSLLPASEGGGSPPAEALGVGADPELLFSGDGRHAISDNGSRVFWDWEGIVGGFGRGGGTALYLRDTVKRESVRLDVKQPGAPSGGQPEAVFQIASSDGSKVFFTDSQHLTAQSSVKEQNLFEYELYECEIVEEAGHLACKLTDLTPERGGLPAGVQNVVLGASEDGSYVYFVANGVYGGGAERGAKQGKCTIDEQIKKEPLATCNLYEYHNGVITFIATLSEEDELDWVSVDHNRHEIGRLTARVSPDGRYVAFMSDRSLTGYDNRDANSGKPDMEVYLYDSSTKRLSCASCNPTGARPVGVEAEVFGSGGNHRDIADIEPLGTGAYTGRSWVASNLPTSDSFHNDWAVYQPRALSDGGRLFFNSNDALVPQDVNGSEDLYQYEPEGTGGCASSSVTFSSKSGGCVGLISAGSSPEESGFMDASEGGGDVFFLTASQLTSQDYDTGYDIYDAHACTAAVPCIAPPVASPPCSSGDSCKASPSPQPSIFGAPASATFTGAGNVTVTASGPVVAPRSLTRAQKLAQALRACRKKPKPKRGACVRQAKRRFAAKSARRSVGATRKAWG